MATATANGQVKTRKPRGPRKVKPKMFVVTETDKLTTVAFGENGKTSFTLPFPDRDSAIKFLLTNLTESDVPSLVSWKRS